MAETGSGYPLLSDHGLVMRSAWSPIEWVVESKNSTMVMTFRQVSPRHVPRLGICACVILGYTATLLERLRLALPDCSDRRVEQSNVACSARRLCGGPARATSTDTASTS